MKKLLLVLILFLTAVFCFAQAFDDLPYTSSDSATWFQQEMSSLMRFQFENDINVPFFATMSIRSNTPFYKPEYVKCLENYGYVFRAGGDDYASAVDMEMGGLLGGQFKINSSFYLPVFIIGAYSLYYSVVYGEWEEYQKGNQVLVKPYDVDQGTYSVFLGTGLNINTDKLKGGIYLGYGISEAASSGKEVEVENFDDDLYRYANEGIKIAIVPLVDTSSMAYIGKALSSVMGFLGMGDSVIYAEREEGVSKISAFFSTINAGLDFTFNRFDFGPLSLKANAIYLRGNYNLVAKADTYGLKLQGRFSNFPFGFSVEGGLKHFFSVSPFMEPYYPDTGYINASVFFPLKYFTIGAIYQYDGIYESRFIFAISTNFLSGFYCYNPRTNYNKNQFDGAEAYVYGARFRWGGWKVKAEK